MGFTELWSQLDEVCVLSLPFSVCFNCTQRCSGLSFVPKSVEKMRLEFCTMSTPDKELEALKVWHPL